MKIRSVRPEFFTDAKMPLLTPSARLLYVGLWCIADDEGRGEYLPKLIEGAVFPHEQVDIFALLRELLDLGRLVVYEVDGQMYFHIPRFEDYQKPNRKYESRLPAPPAQRVGSVDAVREQKQPEIPIDIDDSTETLPTQRVSTADAHAGEGEGEGVRRGSRSIATLEAPRERNQVWDALSDIFGEPETKTARSLRGKVCKSLTEAEATAADVYLRVQAWPMLFPDATLTDIALEKHWTALGRPALRASEQDVTKHKRDLELQLAQEEWERERKAIGR